jgi:hypothetical protein
MILAATSAKQLGATSLAGSASYKSCGPLRPANLADASRLCYRRQRVEFSYHLCYGRNYSVCNATCM